MLCICDQNHADKHNALAIAEERLHSVKAFLFSTLSSTASRLGVGKRLGGNAAGTADL